GLLYGLFTFTQLYGLYLLFCAFLFLVVLMFYKDVDLIYIFCTLLISLLPLLNIIKRYKKKTDN
ncbi:hypothetical protein, partial [Staphylococcus aureus]|uniref:hypothetical protein n=1 Tax=Staphylococcus aureus TaxID=1280 RepID=UPI0035B5DDFF